MKAAAAKKKSRQGVSAESYGAYNKKADFVPKVVQKTEDTKKKLQARLMQAFMFNNLDEKDLAVVIDAIEEAKYNAGEKVIVEGDQGDCMYVLESGSLVCTKVFAGKTEPTKLKDYSPGEGFGELALLYNAPRAATIAATEPSLCWRLDRDTFNHIVKDSA
jgi:cAMP-dependent protein kinase regulator